MKPISRWLVNGNICIGPLTALAIRGGLPADCQARCGCCPAISGTCHQPARCAREDHYRQEWRQHSSHLERQGGRLRRYPDASMQIPQQRRRTGPSGHQTNHPSDTRIQVVLECTNHHRWNRNHAHDPQGADGLSRGQNHVCSQPVLQPCSLISNSATQLLWARLNYCDRTAKAPN